MNKSVLITAILMLLLGIGIGSWLDYTLENTPYPLGHKNMPVNEKKQARQPLFYRNPMNPTVTSPVPAKDAMGMDYIPVYAEDDRPKSRKILFYRSSMNPSVTSPTPAKDAMGMDYIAVYAEEDSDTKAPAGTVKINGTMYKPLVYVQPRRLKAHYLIPCVLWVESLMMKSAWYIYILKPRAGLNS